MIGKLLRILFYLNLQYLKLSEKQIQKIKKYIKNNIILFLYLIRILLNFFLLFLSFLISQYKNNKMNGKKLLIKIINIKVNSTKFSKKLEDKKQFIKTNKIYGK